MVPGLPTKSGLMVGLGETRQELKQAWNDLAAVGVQRLTIGQYLQPTRLHHPVERYYEPEEFAEIEVYGNQLGFTHVASGPMVRSSYHADRMAMDAGFVSA